ncbi:MAG: hypothetical protein LBJ73_00785 [Rickettsiales bacterium]|jgi:hypothetical protein|nr:hypothetical protein [Rickettsiales bacterium]
MKYTLKNNLIKMAVWSKSAALTALMFMAACDGTEPIEPVNPTPEPGPEPKTEKVQINLNALSDFESNLKTPRRDGKTYDAFVLQDIAADSVGLAKTLADWKSMNDTVPNLKTDWKGKGIYVPKKKTVYAFGDYVAAGMPKIIANPENGVMPSAASAADSTEYSKLGLTLEVRREKASNDAETVEDLANLVNAAQVATEPVVINVTDVLEVGNGNAGKLEAALAQIVASPNISVGGKIEIAPTSDSVAVTNAFIGNLAATNGRIVGGGANALFINDVKDSETLRTVLADGARVRTDVSVNFANTDIAIPNQIIYNANAQLMGAATKSAAVAPTFAQGVRGLPSRNGWRNKNYRLRTESSIDLYNNEEEILSRISQPSVRGTVDYPNPDIWCDNDPVYRNIFLDKTRVYSDSVGLAINQRVKGSHGQTKIRTVSMSSAMSYDIAHYYEDANMVTKSPGGIERLQVILLHINSARLPLNNPVLAEHADLHVFPYTIDAMKYCFVVPDNVVLEKGDGFEVMFENDRKVMKLIEGAGVITISNRKVNDAGAGILGQRKSFFWITSEEYAQYVADGKRAR